MSEQKKRSYRKYDIIPVLRTLNIFYMDHGKNVTRGWVNVNCPFCHDPSWHLGINLSNSKISCWKCGRVGTFAKFIFTLLGQDSKLARETLRNNVLDAWGGEDYSGYYETEEERVSVLKWPTNLTSEIPDIHAKYLINRGLDVSQTVRTFRLQFSNGLSYYNTEDRKRLDFRYRILAPMYIGGNVVNYAGRDITGREESVRWKNCPNEEAPVTTKNCLYGTHTLQGERAILVEGPSDVWSMGRNVIGVNGIKVTGEQIMQLSCLNLKSLGVLFDKGAKDAQEKMIRVCSQFIPEVFEFEDLWDDYDDPGNLSRKQVKEIRKIYFGE